MAFSVCLSDLAERNFESDTRCGQCVAGGNNTLFLYSIPEKWLLHPSAPNIGLNQRSFAHGSWCANLPLIHVRYYLQEKSGLHPRGRRLCLWV